MKKENSDRRAELRDRLREALSYNSMKPIELSEKTGIPKSMVSYYLSGKSVPKADRIYKIAQALDVNEAWLMGYDVPMHRTPEQKKNDTLADVVVRLRTDADFCRIVEGLHALDEEKLRSVGQLLRFL